MSIEKPITFAIHTIGCKTNQAESDDIARQLVLKGCRQAEISDAADAINTTDAFGGIDCIIINTCTVTAAADKKARQLIRKLKSASPKSKLIVTGCFAELNRELVKDSPADFIFSNSKKKEIADFVFTEALVKEGSRVLINPSTAPDPVEPVSETTAAVCTNAAAAEPTSGKIIAACPIAAAAAETYISTDSTAASAAFSEKAGSMTSLQQDNEEAPAISIVPVTGKEPRHTHSRAFVKIQDGCRQGCSYCIVPLVRGPYLSTDPVKIIADIKNLVYQGHDEIVLTGIHIGKFGVDLLSKKTAIKTLPGLVLEILKNTGVKRLRLSSMEINEIDESLIGIIQNNGPAIAPHLHIPLQSGSDIVLKAMNRKYNSDFFISAVEHIKKAIPGITITTDIIVGFPGETDEDFTRTIEIVKNICFSRLHVFKYSKRPGTRAAIMSGHLQEKIKTERSRILRELGVDLRNSFIASNINKKLDVVCEEYDMKTGIAGGTSENYIKVYFDLNFDEYGKKKGKILKVSAKSIYSDGLFGVL